MLGPPCSFSFEVPIQIGSLTGEHTFLFSPDLSYLPERDLLYNLEATTFCTPDGMSLELHGGKGPDLVIMCLLKGKGI